VEFALSLAKNKILQSLELAGLFATLVLAAIRVRSDPNAWADPWIVFTGALTAVVVFWRNLADGSQKPSRVLAGYSGVSIIQLSDGLSLLEGTVLVSTDTWGATVVLPAFAEIPEVAMLTKAGPHAEPPWLSSVGKDKFTVHINSSRQAGQWGWRAKGRLLASTDARDA
jgi:hypothetical protein